MNKHILMMISFVLMTNILLGIEVISFKSESEVLFESQLESIHQKARQHFTIKEFERTKNRKAKFREKLALRYLFYKTNIEHRNFVNRIKQFSNDSCDLIIFINGEEELVSNLQITENKVEYNACNDQKGKRYTKNNSEIFMIKYHEGKKEMFSKEDYPVLKKVKKKALNPYKENTSGILTLGIISGFFLFLLGIFIFLAFEKGPRRKAFFKGWAIGILITLLIRVVLEISF